MANNEAYMLQRNAEESSRLDTQHTFLRALAHGELIHPSIPRKPLRAVADVGAGTGVWLKETAQELENTQDRLGGVEYIGFDISPSQFPHDKAPGIDFVVHDVNEPFPHRYHAKFDLVHVRFLSYAISAPGMLRVVENVVQILRPGGFLQWQECDAIDSWATPEMPTARSTIAYVVSERLARGLTPAVVTPLLKAIQSLSSPIPHGKVSPLNWTEDVMRVAHLETLSTVAHRSPIVQSEKGKVIKAAALQLLQAGVSRRQDKAADPLTTEVEAQRLVYESEEMKNLAEGIKAGGEYARSAWDMAMTWIVAKKAIVFDDTEPWMFASHK